MKILLTIKEIFHKTGTAKLQPDPNRFLTVEDWASLRTDYLEYLINRDAGKEKIVPVIESIYFLGDMFLSSNEMEELRKLLDIIKNGEK